MNALGGPFEVPSSPAVFTSSPAQNIVFGNFSWATDCSHVRQQPYQVIFNARDNYELVQLQDYESMFITVVAPAPQNPSATPDGGVMDLAWDPSICSNASGYRIYRRQGSYGFIPDHCETGVPAYTGYQYIGSTTGLNSTGYVDHGLSFGITYCYMVVAVFPDGAQSYASVEFCNMLEREVPIMTNVSVVPASTQVSCTSAITGGRSLQFPTITCMSRSTQPITDHTPLKFFRHSFTMKAML
jgi:hypothetical protein